MKTEEIKFTCTTCKYFKSSGQNKYLIMVKLVETLNRSTK